jgi:hypothetical protein
MSRYQVILYAYVDKNSNELSYLLLYRKINHSFVLDDKISMVIETCKRKRELMGFQQVLDYLQKYKYIFEFPEVETWN